ncbi:MAG: hypothetical protein M1832_005152 [Thelocarpon impressellum]|nr:MAG: hypothetical protein M1832_005152 [Thelocarpon impressellum]
MQRRISESGLRGEIRVSNLRYLVVSDDSLMLLGSLFDVIPSLARNLDSALYNQARHHHEKWEGQVTRTVEKLHANGLVWGDVHPGNIIIDMNGDAWCVDFGGGCVEEFIDRENVETEEGDWQGLRKIFQDWIKRKSMAEEAPESSAPVSFTLRR